MLVQSSHRLEVLTERRPSRRPERRCGTASLAVGVLRLRRSDSH